MKPRFCEICSALGGGFDLRGVREEVTRGTTGCTQSTQSFSLSAKVTSRPIHLQDYHNITMFFSGSSVPVLKLRPGVLKAEGNARLVSLQ